MRIVFMGTPDFARTILERLVADGHDVCFFKAFLFTDPCTNFSKFLIFLRRPTTLCSCAQR